MRLNFLDVLRTFAILFVMLRHTLRPLLPDSSGTATVDEMIWQPIKNLMMNGWVGVDLFFLLSGFLIAQPFLRSTEISISHFYINRGLRILPAYCFVTAIICLGIFPFYTIPSTDIFRSLLSHSLFIQDYTGADINVVLWSLGVEIKFYLIAPLVIAIISRHIHVGNRNKALLFTILFIFLAPLLRITTYYFTDGIDDYYGYFRLTRSPFHTSMDGLFYGILLAVLFHEIRPKLEKITANWIRIIRIIFVTSAFTQLWFLMSHELLAKITFFDVAFQTSLVSFLFFCTTFSGLCLFYKQPPTLFFSWGSKLSYSIYLVHWPLIPLCLFIPTTLEIGSPESSLASTIVYSTSLWILSIILAYAIYLFIERPALKLKRS